MTNDAATDLWSELLGASATQDGYVRRRIGGGSDWGLYAAARQPGRTLALLLEVPTRALIGVRRYPTSAGFTIEPSTISPGSSGRTRLELNINDREFEEVFRPFCSLIVKEMSSVTDAKQATEELLKQLFLWQQFLASGKRGKLGPQEQQGLFGELRYLQRLATVIGFGGAVEWWRGPYRTAQDFEQGRLAVEVKTCKAAGQQNLRIASVTQLLPADGVQLFVYYVWLDVRQGASKTLPELIDRVREDVKELAPSSSPRLEDALERYGYLDEHRRNYLSVGYELRKERAYEVRGGFPRILPDELCAGVVGVKYDIELSACDDYEVSLEDLDKVVGEKQ